VRSSLSGGAGAGLGYYMFNLYFTDWDSTGMPIPNGLTAVLKYRKQLTAEGRILDDDATINRYFEYFNFTSICNITNNSYTFCDKFVDNFIFPIEFKLETPTIELVIDLGAIVTPDIVTNINKCGYLLLLDNEGYIGLSDKLISEAISLGVDKARIIYIIGAYTKETDNIIYWELSEDISYASYIYNPLFKQLLINLHKAVPADNTLYLVNDATETKIKMYNALYLNNLIGISSLIHVPEALNYLVLPELLDKVPIILDKCSKHGHFATLDRVRYGHSCHIHILNNPRYKPHFDNQYRHNGDIYLAAMCKRPFIAAYDRQVIPEINRLGYRSFNPIIDESYDTQDFDTKVSTIINILKTLNYSTLLEETKDITEHNFRHFFRTNRTAHNVINKINTIIRK